MATAKKKRKKKKGRLRRKFELAVLLTILVLIAMAGNWIYQVWKKPSELIGVFENHFHKDPESTWSSYSEVFRQRSTPIITPDFLAALAQTESNGNPIVRTYWKFRWTTDPSRIFAPASSAVGMFQITEGTFEEAKRFCIEEGRVRSDDSDGDYCSNNRFYSRLIPSHAIEMTAARLHYHTERIVRRYGLKRVSLRDKQSLATVIHLCGVGKAERLARARLRLSRIGRCGDHSPVGYVSRIRKLQTRFKKLDQQDQLVASRSRD